MRCQGTRIRPRRELGSRRPELSEYVRVHALRRHDAALIRAFKGDGHVRSGQLLRAGPKEAILHTIQAQCGRAEGARPPDKWSRRAVILSPRLRRAAVAALAGFAGPCVATSPGMLSAPAEAPSRFSRTSAPGSFLHAPQPRRPNGSASPSS